MSWTDWLTGPGGVSGVTNGLGVTAPLPPNLATPDNPAYKNLLDAANQYNTDYQGAQGQFANNKVDLRDAGIGENQTIAQLRAAASGAPTAATNLMRAQTDQNSRNAINAAAAYTGTNPGEALRAGLSSAQQTQIGSTASGAAMAAQEQEAARQTLAGATGQNLNAANSEYSTGAGVVANAANAYNSANQAPFNAQMGQQQLQVQGNAANQAAMGQIYGAIGKGIAASDPQLKTDVKDGSHMSDEFLASLAPKEFDYKNPGAPGQAPGHRLGVMATDLPKHDVTTGPDGKKWISADAISDILGGLGRLHQRVSGIEAARAYA